MEHRGSSKADAGSNATIEHWFLAEHYLINWSNWTGLLDRFRRCFGQEIDNFPKSCSQLIANCNVLAFGLARDAELDEAIARSWSDQEPMVGRVGKCGDFDMPSVYTQIARNYERAQVLSRADQVQPDSAVKAKLFKQMTIGRGDFGMSRSVILEQNERLLDRWQELPRRVQD